MKTHDGRFPQAEVEEVFAIEAEARRLQRETDAALVEAAGCVCSRLNPLRSERAARIGDRVHDEACPVVLAAQIRGLA